MTKFLMHDSQLPHEAPISMLDGEERPHTHWSIINVTADGVVDDVDWGYHTEAEARRYANLNTAGSPDACHICNEGVGDYVCARCQQKEAQS